MQNTTSEKIRVVSFLAIILVVFLHSYNLDFAEETAARLPGKSWNWFVQDLISYGFTRVAVPIFFIFSGFWFFYSKEHASVNFIGKITKRVRTLLVPFLFWSLFGIGLYFVLQSLPQFHKFFSKELVKDYTLQMWLLKIFIEPIPYQLWFIRDLMVLVLISPLIYLMIKYFGKFFIVILFIPWFCDFNSFHNSIEAILFFTIGSYIAIYMPDILAVNFKSKTKYFIPLWIFMVVAKTCMSLFNIQYDLIAVFSKIGIIIGIFSFWGLYDTVIRDNISIRQLFLKLSSMTFFVFASHEPIMTMVKKLFYLILGNSEAKSMIVYVAAPITTIITAMFCAIVLKKYAGGFYKIITGGR